MKNTKSALREYEFEVFVLIVLAIWVMGACGFVAALEMPWSLKDSANAFYLSLQLFVMNSGAMDVKQYSYCLEFARWAAPLCLGTATVRTVFLLAKERNNKFRLGVLHDHVVICGLGTKGAILTSDLLDLHKPVVVIDLDPANPFRENMVNRGAIFLDGNASDPALLENARIQRASHIFALTGDDAKNLSIAQTAHHLMEEHATGKLECLVHVHNAELRRLFYSHRLFDKTYAHFDARLFDCYEKGARRLLQDHFSSHLANVGSGRTEFRQHHLLLIGFGWLCRSFAVQAARTGCYPDGRKLKVTVIDSEAEFLSKKLKKEFPAIDQLLDIRFYSLDARLLPQNLEDLYALPFHVPGTDGLLDHCPAHEPIDMAFIGLGDDLLEYSTSLDLSRWFLDLPSPPEVIFCPSGNPGFSDLIGKEPFTKGNVVIRPYRMLEEVCSFESIVNPQLEMLARTIHYDYVREELAKITEEHVIKISLKNGSDANEIWNRLVSFLADFSKKSCDPVLMNQFLPLFAECTGNPSVVTWENLSEEMKDANREQAEHISVKLNLIGCKMVDGLGEYTPCVMTKNEEEMLARVEHARWMADKIIQGWKYGKTRDSLQKTNPLLIPYDDLEQSEKDKDLNTVRNINKLASMLGKTVIRTQSITPSR